MSSLKSIKQSENIRCSEATSPELSTTRRVHPTELSSYMLRVCVVPWGRQGGRSGHNWSIPSEWGRGLRFPPDWALCRSHTPQTEAGPAGRDGVFKYLTHTYMLLITKTITLLIKTRTELLTERHCRRTQVCFNFPGPPNFFMSLQKLQSPHSGLMQASQRLHLRAHTHTQWQNRMA